LVWFGDLLYAHRHRSILLGAADRIILAPANQLMEMGLKILRKKEEKKKKNQK
jgi:hypothetical protein